MVDLKKGGLLAKVRSSFNLPQSGSNSVKTVFILGASDVKGQIEFENCFDWAHQKFKTAMKENC